MDNKSCFEMVKFCVFFSSLLISPIIAATNDLWIVKCCGWLYQNAIKTLFILSYPICVSATCAIDGYGTSVSIIHDDAINWKHFPRYWPLVPGIHLSPVKCPHKGQWRGAFMFSLICPWINGWVNSRDLKRNHVHYDISVLRSILQH